MITNPNPVAVYYEADAHCVSCAEARFGQRLYNREPPTDNEGEKVSFAYSWDEFPETGENCGDCGRVIAEPSESEDENAEKLATAHN